MYRWLEHTSEAELWIEDESPRAVLGEAAVALGELLGEDGGGAEATRRVSAGAADLPTLLAEWLGELVYLAESEGFVPERVAEMDLSAGRLDAVVEGRRGKPQSLVKGVTYHRLEFERGGKDGWHARVILDV
ncbi:MAG: archease [Syntrophothermus sp.]